MITEDQSTTVAFLSSPAAHGGAGVERLDTHASIVFLAGDRAWKLKRAVRYDYLDYSTVDRRRAMCEAEVRVNRRTAPTLYRGVTAVTRQGDGALALGGAGTPVDWLVEMNRFDQSCLLDRMAEAGVLPLQLMPAVAEEIATFHLATGRATDHGGWEAMRRVIDGNASGFRKEGSGILEPVKCATLTDRAHVVLDRGRRLLDKRRDDGWVRHCHGDLHLRNIVLGEGRPILFDAIEFNDEFSSIDVLYDLAFLLMDLWRRGLAPHANAAWNTYLAEIGDLGGLPLMPLFLSCRAAVMAKTVATAANLQSDARAQQSLQTLANEYLTFAAALLDPSPPCLIAVGGLSGSGKSTLAMDLAPSIKTIPGAVVIRSDQIRKKLCGVKPLDRLGPQGYTDEVSRRVYATLMSQADQAVRSGYAAIADAVFAEPVDRAAIQQVAATAGVPFIGLWLAAPEGVLQSRVEGRGPDVSDAGVEVVRRQLERRINPLPWHLVDASGPRREVCEAVAAIVGR